ncbi:MAG: hypothetical protein IPL46_01870 [Saprospiraceae bacterium]|nr:hypothetical protein [Saprospiraceae bacterium]
MPKKPKIVESIEKAWGESFTLYPALPYPSILDGLMSFKKDRPKYALDEAERLIGLNLSETGLDDQKWQRILKLLTEENANLQILDLSHNRLTEFSLGNPLNQVEKLSLAENPLKSPLEEILKQGNEAILRFLKQSELQGTREVYEVKMLIVGEGGTGKTTLWNKLQNEDYPVPLPISEQPMTIGIEIKEGWTFEHLDRPTVDFLVNLWDFGGQEIQYMTHQFFLTRRSFYVLLADGRGEVANFSYWFKVIDLLGVDPRNEDKLTVLVVLNEKGNSIAKIPYDPTTVESDYPRLQIISQPVDFTKKDYKFTALKNAIQEILCRQTPHLPMRIPLLWDQVRQELNRAKTENNYINFSRFKEICVSTNINDEVQMLDLSQMLHDLGIILHYHEDLDLTDFIILNPEWAVKAVYQVLRHEEVIKDQGRFDMQRMQAVWSSLGYSLEEMRHLKNLMLKDNFEVCFRTHENNHEIYIAPQLLPEQRPSFEWTKENKTLQYAYQYPFMPKGIMERLIVRLNENITIKNGKKVLWRKGVLLQMHQCLSLVQETEQSRTGLKLIKIDIQGDDAEDRRFVLRTIRSEIEHIHLRSFPSLRFEEKIPCCCRDCKISAVPHFLNLVFKETQGKRKNGGSMCFAY